MLINDHFQNHKRYNIPRAQLIFEKAKEWINITEITMKELKELGFAKTIMERDGMTLFSSVT